MAETWVNEHGFAVKELPADCVADCSGPGPADEAVRFWKQHLGFDIPRTISEPYLRSTGGWESEELAEASDDNLSEICLWLAAGDVYEQGAWLGCCE